MYKELLNNLKAAKDMAIQVTVMETLGGDLHVNEGIIHNIVNDEAGFILVIDGSDYLIKEYDKIDEVKKGNRKFYSVVDATSKGWNLNIIL